MRSSGSRPALTSATTSAIARTGSFTPVLECTQVSATSRVSGRMASRTRLTIWSALLALSGSYEQLFTYVMFASILFSVAAGIAHFVLRRTKPDHPRPYRTWGYPVTPILFLVVVSYLLVNAFVTAPVQAFTGIGLILLGLPFYWYWTRRAMLTNHELRATSDER